eukprot:TRINITY_DN6152_c0_g1_i3.p1 TRINITY_DN6152_c0_g1~~TRINITY_DN6152_c0_g1_i3.p1  ORF type:complete len:196 (-),score=13.27 TRINITY_DN6152_c0_g1_i3:927-1514(-)
MVDWVFALLKRLIKPCWESGYRWWGFQARVLGGGFYCVNISWVMEVGVFQTKSTRFQVYKGLLFLFKRILILGFAIGFIMAIMLNFSMMSGVGELVLKNQFPNFFWWIRGKTLLLQKNCGSGRGVVWNFSFSRNLTNIETSDFAALLGILNKVSVSVGRDDKRLWKPTVKCQFLVKPFNHVLVDNSSRGKGRQSF